MLNKGLTFCTSHEKLDINKLDTDIRRFERRLQLYYFFKNKNKSNNTYLPSQNNKFQSNPIFWPKKLNAHITKFCSDLQSSIQQLHSHKPNLNKHEIKALHNLKSNTQITIKKGDKGAGICILNTVDYVNKITSMLQDTMVYTQVTEDPTNTTKELADRLIDELFNFNYINKKQQANLQRFKPTTPKFYGIPKVHKENIPLRPIVSQINGPTMKINELVDYYLSVAEKQIPTLFKDSTSFLQFIEQYKNTVTEHTFFVTLDITSLYTNIPHEEGIKLVCDYYEETLQFWSSTANPPPVTRQYLHILIKFILDNCTFSFGHLLYKQNFGTTMGAKFSVKYANIYVYKLLQKFFNTYQDSIPEATGRLVDDIFFFWNHSEESLQTLYRQLNSFHPTIKFELKYSRTEIQFLDTVIYKSDSNVHTKIYTKPTDKKLYLHYNSSHPYHTKRSIPFSQAIRYRRIITEDSVLQQQLLELKDKFVIRGYPQHLILQQINKAQNIPRNETLTYKNKEHQTLQTDNFLPLIINYHPSFTSRNKDNIYKICTAGWQSLLDSNSKLSTIFKNTTPKIVFKRGTTISNYLTSTRYFPHLDETDQNNINILSELASYHITINYQFKLTICQHPRCKCCSHIPDTNIYKMYNIPLNTNMDCNSKDLIYLIICSKCKKKYVGETTRKLKDRLNNHTSDIRLKKNTTISIHFNSYLHTLHHLQILPIQLLSSNQHTQRHEIEKYWINRLHTSYPYGLNFYPIIHS